MERMQLESVATIYHNHYFWQTHTYPKTFKTFMDLGFFLIVTYIRIRSGIDLWLLSIVYDKTFTKNNLERKKFVSLVHLL